jgi:hypothetical protein
VRVRHALLLLLFAGTLFVSASLLFLVQPMVGKMLLPYLGGTPAVWNTCMVFFQALLLAGYSYAHVTTSWLGVRRQTWVHLAVLLLPALTLPIALNKSLVPQGQENPIFGAFLVLLLAAGLPFFAVATTAPLLQKWFADTGHPAAKDPYFLYGASNLGSMLALLSYPLLVEPAITLQLQSKLWAAAYGLLVLLTVLCALTLRRAPATALGGKQATPGPETPAARPGLTTRLHWIVLAFVPSSLMLGVTTYLTTDIAAIPFLWVLPLALYLLSFILVFSRIPEVVHQVMCLVLPPLILYFIFLQFSGLNGSSLSAYFLRGREGPSLSAIMSAWATGERTEAILVHLLTLFVVAMVCHGELARRRPAPAHLTEFYLLLSLGGVLGGLFNSLVAPVLFESVLEYPLVIVLACLLLPRRGPLRRTAVHLAFDLVLLGVVLVPAVDMMRLAFHYGEIELPPLLDPVHRYTTLLVGGMAAGTVLLYLLLLAKRDLNRWLDLVQSLVLAGLFLGTLWGLKYLALRSPQVRRLLPLDGSLQQGIHFGLLAYGLPLLYCLTFLRRPMAFGFGVGACFLVGSIHAGKDEALLHQERDYFGILTVVTSPQDRSHALYHGRILHGAQRWYRTPDALVSTYLPALGSAPANAPLTTAMRHLAWLELHRQPILYFHPDTPFGQLFASFQGAHAKKNVAITGLGTGGLAGFGRPGQKFTYFEIDPAVERIARDPQFFTYLRDAEERGVQVEVRLGDARLQMEKVSFARPEDSYDLIILDAFTSDAIPVHLVNYNALQLYLSKLAPQGILVFHISNRYVNLAPVLARMAEQAGLVGLIQEDDDNGLADKYETTVVILARQWSDFGELAHQPRWTRQKLDTNPSVGFWTDDYSNLLGVFRWKDSQPEASARD